MLQAVLRQPFFISLPFEPAIQINSCTPSKATRLNTIAHISRYL